MTYLLWQSEGAARIASPRLVLRAAEVPLLRDAQSLRDRLQHLHDEAAQQLATAAGEVRAQAQAQGRQAGLQAARDEVAGVLALLAQRAEQERERQRGEIAALALQVVRKLLGGFSDDATVVALAATAAREALPAQPQRLLVHPSVQSAVRERLAAFADAQAARGTHVAPLMRCEVRADASLAPTGCRLETEFGSVDASLDAQLDRLAQAWGVAGNGAGA